MSHSERSDIFLLDAERTTWHDETLWFVREKRDKAVYATPEFQKLRQLASDIKDHTLSRLDFYLQQFEENARRNGVHVHWAADATEHNAIVLGLLRQHGATRVVKSKSMLTEECHLNPHLLANGIEVIDTDLGERIIQLREEAPSHVVLPAIHLKKEDVGDTFHKYLGTEKGNNDPQQLTETARQHLREKFLAGQVAISGVNFAVAETGTVVVCTNEGNADLGVNLAQVHIACMGMEKLIPRLSDLSVFTRILTRSATGQPITTYTSHFTRPAEGKELHIVIVDNGRTQQLGRPDFRASLKCIRCGACMNTCPVYRRSGGHSYDFTIPGPIGAILSPNIDMRKHASLPFASTLCGSCTDVCPVKIDIHTQLYKWRQVLGEAGKLPASKKWSMRLLSRVLAKPGMYSAGGKVARQALRLLPHGLTHGQGYNPWAIARELPEPPQQSFREWYAQQPQNDKA
ncbi:lactate utilization protein [Microvirga sp. STR05]|uniref:Lactate utilization protein n=1 Tax=Hymenobacter duratus TaxID=2771356 RepID=A0ABR8JLC8_9BACT|nr:lactate utilization protein B [Hymenobacter duratus]MBD2716431.1 lactate utilization protein [Hymenobacter duratus]MBR7951346.1 lactate utilization protein [Microvirga sp. STR05]